MSTITAVAGRTHTAPASMVAIDLRPVAAPVDSVQWVDRYAAVTHKDTEAIIGFLRQHWVVSLDDAHLRQLVLGLLAFGKERGRTYLYQQLKSQLEGQKREVDAVNKLLGQKRFHPIEFQTASEPLGDFATCAEKATQWVRATFGRVTARPNGYAQHRKTADEYDEQTPEARDFKGGRLHFMLGATNLDFGWNMSRVGVYYNEVRGRSPLATLVSTTLQQGMNIPLVVDYSDLTQRLKRQQERIDTALPDAPLAVKMARFNVPADLLVR